MNAKHLAALVGVPLAVLGLCLATIHLRIGAALHRSRPPPEHLLAVDLPSTRLALANLTLANTLDLRIRASTTLNLAHLTTPTSFLSRIETRLFAAILRRTAAATLASSAPIQLFDAAAAAEPLLEIRLQSPARLSLRDAQTTLHLRLRFPGPAHAAPSRSPAAPSPCVWPSDDLRLRLDTHPDQHSWTDALFRSLAHLRLPHLTLHLPVTLPKVPAEWADPAALLTLSTYAFFPIPAEDTSDGRAGVGIRATVAAPNPLLLLRRHIRELDVAVDVPWPIPLSVLLVHGPRHRLVPLASSHTLPFALDPAAETLALAIEGFLLPSLASPNSTLQGEEDDDPLSGFLNRFLAGKPNSLAVRYAGIPRALPAADPRANQIPLSLSAAEVGAPKVPTLISAFLSTLDLRLQFPGSPTPDLLESLEIREMHIGLPGLFPPRAPLRCSGVLHALVVLPAELAGLAGMLDIRLFRPDVVLLDGPLPPSPSAEDGLPESAFASLAPPAFIPASLARSPSTSALMLDAVLDNVPLHILQNRTAVFRRYAAKYVLHHRTNTSKPGEGVQTSMLGTFDAKAFVAGRFRVALRRVAVRGSFFV
ncbi:hypothetical protein PTTG_00605 [Puccinia triticina 1-1 BBBD Race 1]|uniref:Uncharacterized protein n=1 Tax=Puccinia triticina (isolate 1-1 / race 1 (BBBD)) TaxID=630390 RepID=A0A180GN53_PUCT1|nr:hypothetical protein PTTG_00605 [Puccinia triticina 1-1 BBBD Race 1]